MMICDFQTLSTVSIGEIRVFANIVLNIDLFSEELSPNPCLKFFMENLEFQKNRNELGRLIILFKLRNIKFISRFLSFLFYERRC